jgi:hypothetical protein
MRFTTLPCSSQNLRRRGLEPFMCIGDNELHATKPAPPQRAQEVTLESLRLRRIVRHVLHFARTLGVDGDCIIAAFATIRPASRDFTKVASAHRYGQSPSVGHPGTHWRAHRCGNACLRAAGAKFIVRWAAANHDPCVERPPTK